MRDIVTIIIISILAAVISTLYLWLFNRNAGRIHLMDLYMGLLVTFWVILINGLYNLNYRFIFVGIVGILLFSYFIKNQVFIDDSEFVKAMIDYHSVTVFMAKKIKEKSKNQKVIKLADEIIEIQTKEMKDMENIEKMNL